MESLPSVALVSGTRLDDRRRPERAYPPDGLKVRPVADALADAVSDSPQTRHGRFPDARLRRRRGRLRDAPRLESYELRSFIRATITVVGDRQCPLVCKYVLPCLVREQSRQGSTG